MDFHELEAFAALARQLHFARAAAALNTSPSALSRMVTRLEDEVGTRLLDRDTRRVELTEDGEAFLAFAQESLHRREELRLNLGAHDERLRGILRLYASVTACYTIIPPLVALLSAEHPELRLAVHTGDPAGAIAALREGRVDLALSAIPEGGFPDVDCFPVRSTPLVFAGKEGGAFTTAFQERMGMAGRSDDASLKKALDGIPLILPAIGLARERFDRWARRMGLRPCVAAETEGNEAILALAHLGLGLGLVPRLVLESGPFASGLMLHSAERELGGYDIGFVQRRVGREGESSRKRSVAIAEILKKAYRGGTPANSAVRIPRSIPASP